MFGLSLTELIVIFIVALIVLGPERLPGFARDLGRTLNELKRTMDKLRREMTLPPDFLTRDIPPPADPQKPSQLTAVPNKEPENKE